MKLYLQLAAALLATLLVLSLFYTWRSLRQQQQSLQAELQSTQQQLAAATSRQASRDTSLNALLARLNQQKAQVKNPTQIIQDLPAVLPLPQPISLAPANSTQPNTPEPKPNLSADDLKPLYDFALDCKAFQAQLATSQANLKDEQVKTAALGRERDDALRAAKGGSILHRMARAAKWFALGAAAGAIAAKAAHR